MHRITIATLPGIFSALVLLWTLPTGYAAGDQVLEMSRDIHRRIIDAEQWRERIRHDREQHERRLDALRKQTERLRRDLRTLETENRQWKDDVESLQQRHDELASESADMEIAAALLCQATGPLARSMQARIAAGLESAGSMRPQWTPHADGPCEDRSTTKRLGDVLRLVDAAIAELSAGQERVLENRTIDVDGRRRNAYVYRLGLLSMGFVTESDHTAGLFDPATGSWRTDWPAEFPEQAAAIVDTMRRKRPPAILPTPCIGAGRAGDNSQEPRGHE